MIELGGEVRPVTAIVTGRTRALRRLRRDLPAMISAGILVLLVAIATVGAPLAAHLTGHPPTKQFPDAISINGLPIGVMDRPYL